MEPLTEKAFKEFVGEGRSISEQQWNLGHVALGLAALDLNVDDRRAEKSIGSDSSNRSPMTRLFGQLRNLVRPGTSVLTGLLVRCGCASSLPSLDSDPRFFARAGRASIPWSVSSQTRLDRRRSSRRSGQSFNVDQMWISYFPRFAPKRNANSAAALLSHRKRFPAHSDNGGGECDPVADSITRMPLAGTHLNLARPYFRTFRDSQSQNAVLEAGVDVLGV